MAIPLPYLHSTCLNNWFDVENKTVQRRPLEIDYIDRTSSVLFEITPILHCQSPLIRIAPSPQSQTCTPVCCTSAVYEMTALQVIDPMSAKNLPMMLCKTSTCYCMQFCKLFMILVIMVGAEWEEKEEKLGSTHPSAPNTEQLFCFLQGSNPKANNLLELVYLSLPKVVAPLEPFHVILVHCNHML